MPSKASYPQNVHIHTANFTNSSCIQNGFEQMLLIAILDKIYITNFHILLHNKYESGPFPTKSIARYQNLTGLFFFCSDTNNNIADLQWIGILSAHILLQKNEWKTKNGKNKSDFFNKKSLKVIKLSYTNLPLSSTDIGFSTTTVWVWEWGIENRYEKGNNRFSKH